MTWYADEIILRATPRALELVRASPQLEPFSYVVRSLDGHEWHSPEIRHTLPTEGLLFIRPVGDFSPSSSNWYRTRTLDWTTLPAASESASYLDQQVTRQLSSDLGNDLMPPPSFRSAVASLASMAQQVVIYYSCFMWGGDIEYEYCLVYEPTESLFITKSDLLPEGSGHEDSLRAGLGRLGLMLPTGYFAPHARSFEWEAYKL